MRTRVLDVADVERAAEILKGGGLVAFPTETVYGLGALGLDPAAVERIFVAKGRPHSDPLILHVADPEWVRALVRELPPAAQPLVSRFWPGPLTLVLPRSERVPDRVTAGLDSVAVRMPRHPVALELIRRVGEPLAAPSANLFGHTSPTTAQHVLADLNGRIDAVLDAGPTEVGVESTVLDVRGDTPILLRPGGVTREELEQALGLRIADCGLRIGEAPIPNAEPHEAVGSRQKAEGRSPESQPAVLNTPTPQHPNTPTPQASPGLLSKHYSPRAEVRLYDGEDAAVAGAIREFVTGAETPEKMAVLAFTEDLPLFQGLPALLVDLGSRYRLQEVAQNLYATFRRMDDQGVSTLLLRTAPPGGLADAINDRMTRAASGRVMRVQGSGGVRG
jgi:L-threonylcarbamoyladenylate synthase